MTPPNVTYPYYKDVYGGTTIAEDEWTGYAAKAVAYLERESMLSTIVPYGDDDERAWSMALCAVAEEYHNFDVVANGWGGNGPAKSASIGSVSVSYDNTFSGSVDLSPAGQARALHDAASRYLHIYLGIG